MPTSNLESTGAMNVLAGTVDHDLTAAANVYAGTSGLSADRALNAAIPNNPPNQQYTATGAANVLAGTSGLSLRQALNTLVDALP